MDDQYNQGAGAPPPPDTVPSYLVQSILVTIFCCMPFGIPALIFAAQSDGMLKAGDPVQAAEIAKKAKMWCWVSFAVGLVYVLGVGLMYAGMFASAFAAAGGAAGGF